MPSIAYQLGWHLAFIFAGIAGLIWIAVWWPLLDLPEKSRRVSAGEIAYINSDEVNGSNNGEGMVSWGAVLRHREAWSFIAAKFLTDPVWWFFLIWLPDFFKKTCHLDIKNSWVLLVSIYSIVIVFSIAGSWMTGYLTTRGWSVTRARKTGMLVFATCVLPISLVTEVSDWTAVLLVGLAGASHLALSANLYNTVSDMFPKRVVATLVGIGSTGGPVGGIIFPLLIGYILDHFANGYGIAFGFCSVAYLIGFAANHALANKFDPVAFEA